SATLTIAGRGKNEYEEKLKAMVIHPDISFLGYVKSTEFYPMIDVLVVPSLWEEPLGMVAIEALANHLPVIANKRGGLKETVIEGVNGLFCDASSPNSLGMAISKLYEDLDLYHKLSGAARESVAHILSEERMIGEYHEVMNSFNQRLSSLT